MTLPKKFQSFHSNDGHLTLLNGCEEPVSSGVGVVEATKHWDIPGRSRKRRQRCTARENGREANSPHVFSNSQRLKNRNTAINVII